MTVAFKTKNTCTGCSACAAVCPMKAIAMQKDEKGFPYPFVDTERCTDCGLCLKQCPQETKFNIENTSSIYAIIHNSDEIRAKSTSGGAFTAISDIILKQNGVVYGAVFNKDFSVKHIRATTEETRNLMRGSKYVKSTVSPDIYYLIKQDLVSGKKVLFSGTPCQVAGVKAFLNKDYPNLITVDLVCHGTPSEKVWLTFLSEVQRLKKNIIENVRFRSKEKSWHKSELMIYGKKQHPFSNTFGKMYNRLFLKHYAHSPACFECKYCNYNRISDLTIADFWGIEKTMPEIDDDKGISLCLVNSEKGTQMFDIFSKDCKIYKSNVKDCAQAHLLYPPKMPDNYNDFWKEFCETSYPLKTIFKFSGITYTEIFKDKLRPILQKLGILKKNNKR